MILHSLIFLFLLLQLLLLLLPLLSTTTVRFFILYRIICFSIKKFPHNEELFAWCIFFLLFQRSTNLSTFLSVSPQHNVLLSIIHSISFFFVFMKTSLHSPGIASMPVSKIVFPTQRAWVFNVASPFCQYRPYEFLFPILLILLSSYNNSSAYIVQWLTLTNMPHENVPFKNLRMLSSSSFATE